MWVLGIETATAYGSVALVGPEGLAAEETALVPMRHLEWLMPAVDRVLGAARIDRGQVGGLAVSHGPGGFTGLRIGIATAAAWARAAEIPVVGVSTLEALAGGVAGPGLVAPVLDAKRAEVAAALFRREDDLTLTRLEDDMVLSPDALGSLIPRDPPVLILGDALVRYGELIARLLPAARLLPRALWTPRAALVAARGRTLLLDGQQIDPFRLSPVYGRRPYVEAGAG